MIFSAYKYHPSLHNLQLVTDYYQRENAVLDSHQRIVFKEDQIELDVPFPSSLGIATENEWRILTLSPPVVSIRTHDDKIHLKNNHSCR